MKFKNISVQYYLRGFYEMKPSFGALLIILLIDFNLAGEYGW
jgi:hypothetical protein